MYRFNDNVHIEDNSSSNSITEMNSTIIQKGITQFWSMEATAHDTLRVFFALIPDSSKLVEDQYTEFKCEVDF